MVSRIYSHFSSSLKANSKFSEVQYNRFINVIDLFKLDKNHPQGLSEDEFIELFTKDKPIIFNFHGYPNLIHELVYDRENKNIHVHGYKEEGTITTSFDMRVQNEIDRYHLVLDVLRYVEVDNEGPLRQYCINMLYKHYNYIREYGVDMPEIDE